MTAQQQAVVNEAKKYLGVSYVEGGKSPSGFDCSGFVQYVYQNAVGMSVLAPTTTQENYGNKVSLNSLLPGDLLFFGTIGATYHVAIYIGDDRFIHASTPGDVVKITERQYFPPSFARRILPEDIPVSSVIISPSTVTLKLGETYKLLVTLSPSNATNTAISWSTSNGAIATVDAGGTVKAVGVGSAIISAVNSNSGKKASCIVTTILNETVPPTVGGFSIGASNPTLMTKFALAVSGVYDASGIQKVEFWITKKGVTSYKKIDGADKGNGCWDVLFDLSIFNNEYGTYVFNAAVYDKCGNLTNTAPKEIQILATLDKLIESHYKDGLGRIPTSQEMGVWHNRLSNYEYTFAHFSEKVYLGEEYIAKNTSDDQYVSALYKSVLGREADAQGKQFHINLITGGMGRKYVLARLILSDEFTTLCKSINVESGKITLIDPREQNIKITFFINRFYKDGLKRKADIQGLNTWTDRLLNKGYTGAQVAEGFILGSEFSKLTMSDADFIETLYLTLFGRASDAQGKQAWLDRIKTLGLSRRELVKRFVESKEYLTVCQELNIIQGEIK